MKKMGNQFELYNQSEASQMCSDIIVLSRMDRQCIPPNLINSVSEALEGRVIEVSLICVL